MYLTQQYSVYFRNGFPPFIAWISVALFSCCCASTTPSRYGHSVVYFSACFLLRFSSCARLEPGVYYPVLSLVCCDSGTMSFILSTILLPLGAHLQIISIHIFCFTTLVYGRPKNQGVEEAIELFEPHLPFAPTLVFSSLAGECSPKGVTGH